ncbi:hypothetical protein D3875_00650 [Deinococcus cavernae]|uniref:Uncharacterized protein n=1 Tax=Deinococcus cavernae TaxID=2320857 RepID=A0A418VHI0_9DEIO|nr:hypothetical protein [Deinococcus cavernae]RJF75591.1 hypothetical protein D3875_00650 [Deinococcus cavernae]
MTVKDQGNTLIPAPPPLLIPWTATLPPLITDLSLLPTTKSNRHRRIIHSADIKVPDIKEVVITTTYPVRSQQLALDGEVLTAMVLTTLGQSQSERVYLDASLEQHLGDLALHNNSRLTYILNRLSSIEYLIEHHHLDYGGQTPSFKAGRFQDGRGVPYFEWSDEMAGTMDVLRQSAHYTHFHLPFHSSLAHPVSRRLYRHFCRHGIEDIDVITLAEILGIYTARATDNASDTVLAVVPEWGKLHRALDRAMAELVERGLLLYVGYVGTGNDRYAFFDVEAKFL